MHAFPRQLAPSRAQIILLLVFVLDRKLFILQYALKAHVLHRSLLIKYSQALLILSYRDLQRVIVALSLEDGVLDRAGVNRTPELRQACVAGCVDGLRSCAASQVLRKLVGLV